MILKSIEKYSMFSFSRLSRQMHLLYLPTLLPVRSCTGTIQGETRVTAFKSKFKGSAKLFAICFNDAVNKYHN